MTDFHIYEQPTNERIRAFLRLEKLFDQCHYHIRLGSEWDNTIAINSINELLAFTGRSDIKLEILKELERQNSRLERLSRRPQIDQAQLTILLQKQKKTMADLQALTGQFGQSAQTADLLTAVRQKNSVPGCVCGFDLPALEFWLTQPEEIRREQIQYWFKPFQVLDRAIRLVLDVLRHSVEDSEETARNGFYQKSLDTNQMVQLLRISVHKNSLHYPEISAGKHRFSIRFMSNENPSLRPEQSKGDIVFMLRMCAI